MKNWAGNLNFHPKVIAAPRSSKEVQDIILEAIKNQRQIRVRGSAHSWNWTHSSIHVESNSKGPIY